MKHILLYLFACLTLSLQAQTYILLDDLTGFDRSPYQAGLDSAAQGLAAVFELTPDIQSQFKVFDVGFYLHQTKMVNGIPEAFELAKQKAARLAPYYLLFAKQSDEMGLYSEFLVDLRLPGAESGFACIEEGTRKAIESQLREIANNIHLANKKIPFLYADAEKAVMLKLKDYLEQIKDCCTSKARTQCKLCLFEPEEMTSELKNRGFLEFDNSTFTIDSTEEYINEAFKSDFKIQITTKYGDVNYRWSITDALNNFVMTNTGATARVLYFNDLTCHLFTDYLNGNYPVEPTASFGRNTLNSTFSEEIIVLDIFGKQQVFFNMNSADKSEVDAVLGFQHLAAGNRGALQQAMMAMELEKCANGDANSWKEVIETTQHFPNIGDRIESAWKSATMNPDLFSANSTIATKMGDIAIGYGVDKEATTMEEISKSEAENLKKSFVINNANKAYVKTNLGIPILTSYNLTVTDENYTKALSNCINEDYVTITSELVKILKEEYNQHSDYFCFISNTGEVVSINKNKVVKLIFATGGERYEKSGILIPMGTLTFFTIKNSEGKDIAYQNHVDGTYRETDSQKYIGDSDKGDELYIEPVNKDTIRPIIVRPCKANKKAAIAIVQIQDYREPTPTNPATIQSYDFLLEYFFTYDRSTVTAQGKPYASNASIIFDGTFESDLYKEFIKSSGEYAEFHRISSFYLNGLSWIAQGKTTGNFESCISNSDAKAMATTLDLFNNRGIEDEALASIIARSAATNVAFSNLIRNSLFELSRRQDYFLPTSRDVFDIIPLFYERDNLIKGVQEEIDSLPSDDLIAATELAERILKEFIPCEIEQLNFNYLTVKGVIAYLISINLWHVNNTEEEIILTMIDKVPEESCVDFLEFLEGAATPNGFWAKLFDGVDNFILDSNGKKLMQKICNLYVCAVQQGNNKYAFAKAELDHDLVKVEQGEYFSKADVEKVLKHVVPFNYAGIFQRLSSLGLNGLPPTLYGLTNVEVNDDGTMDVTNEIKTFYDTILINQNKSPKSLNPFDPVIVHSGSTFGLAKEFKEENFAVYPAILFYYLNHDAEVRTATDFIVTATDFASIAISGGQLHILHNGIVYMDIASSILSIVGTATTDINPNLSTLMNGFSGLLGVASLTSGIGSIGPKIDAAQLDKQKVIEIISKTEIDVDKAPAYKQILQAIENGDATDLNTLSPSQKEKMREVLLDDEYKELIKREGITQSRINNVISKLLGIINDDVFNLLKKIKELGGIHEKLTIWLEGLKLSNKLDINLVSATKAEAFYDNKRVAILDEANGVKAIDNVTESVRGKDIKEINPEGTYALACKNDKCGLKKGGCFAAGTLIATPSGKKKIEDIQTGDYVYAYDEEKQDTVISRVLQTMQKTWYRFNQIITVQDTFLATPNHPFYIPALKRYVQADSLKVGMRLLTLVGTLMTVTNVAALDTTLPIYNFEVAKHHNYFVGEEGILVHNDGERHCLLLKATIDELVKDWPIDKQFELIEILLKEDDLLEFLQDAPHEYKTSIILAFDLLKKHIPERKDLIQDGLARLADDIRDKPAIGDHLYGHEDNFLAWWFNALYLEKSDYEIIVALTEDLKANKGEDLFNYINPSHLGTEKPTERFFAWAVLNYVKNEQRLDNDLALIKKLSAKLKKYPQIFDEITNPNKKDLYYTAINNLFVDEIQWWYKYRLYRQHFSTHRSNVELDDNFRLMVADLIGIDPTITRIQALTPILGGRFERDLYPRIGQLFQTEFTSTTTGLPENIIDRLRTILWDRGYRVMVTEITCNLSRNYPEKTIDILPRPDMLFFRLDEDGIDFRGAIYWDAKLSQFSLKDAQKNLARLAQSGQEIDLIVQNFGGEVYNWGDDLINISVFENRRITLNSVEIIGTRYYQTHNAIIDTKEINIQ